METTRDGRRFMDAEHRKIVMCTAAFQQADSLLERGVITGEEHAALKERIWSGYYPEMSGLYSDKS